MKFSKVKHHTVLVSGLPTHPLWGSLWAITGPQNFYSAFAEVKSFSSYCSSRRIVWAVFLPSLPHSLTISLGKYLRNFLLRFSMWWYLVVAAHRVVMVTFSTLLKLPYFVQVTSLHLSIGDITMQTINNPHNNKYLTFYLLHIEPQLWSHSTTICITDFV